MDDGFDKLDFFFKGGGLASDTVTRTYNGLYTVFTSSQPSPALNPETEGFANYHWPTKVCVVGPQRRLSVIGLRVVDES